MKQPFVIIDKHMKPFCFRPDCEFNQYYVEDNIKSIIVLNDDTKKEIDRYMYYSDLSRTFRYVCENCIEKTVK